MSYGLKAYSSVAANSLVIDDTFSSWQAIQTGTLLANNQLINLNQTFAESSTSAPAICVKFLSSSTYYCFGASFYGTSPTVSQFTVGDYSGLSLGSSVSGLSYRIYKQLNLSAQNLKYGHGLNIFDASGNTIFSTNVNPLIFDFYGIIDCGFNTLSGVSAGWYGNEYNTGMYEPFVMVNYTAAQSIIPLSPTYRLILTLVPVFYHTSGTLRIRFYVYSYTSQIGYPVYTHKAYGSNTIQQPFFGFDSTRSA